MLRFTCGSKQSINYNNFDGVVGGFHLGLWREPKLLDIPNKIYRGQFLYGNRHKVPHPNSKCETLVEWVGKDVRQFPTLNEWVLVNEFTDDLGVPYPLYKIDDLKRYFEAAHIANPSAKLILGDFRPFLLEKWEAIALITEELKAEGLPVEVGVQTHLKFVTLNPFKWNAPIALGILPRILEMFTVPVHLIEASLWYDNELDRMVCRQMWNQLIEICNQHQVKSFCQWWLYPDDVTVPMPTFKDLKVFTDYID